MPVLIVVFAAGAYGFGALLRGSDVIVNEVAIVRGAPGATDGTAQVYLGVFSPSRGTYQVARPGRRAASSPINGDFFGGGDRRPTLDVLQGDPSRVRNLGVGFGSLRTVRAETAVDRPARRGRPPARGRPAQGHGHERVRPSARAPAVVLGGDRRVARRPRARRDARPSTSASQHVQFGQQLSDRIVGPVFFGDPTPAGEDRRAARTSGTRSSTSSPTTRTRASPASCRRRPGRPRLGRPTSSLPVEIEGQDARRTGNVLYYLPAGSRSAARPRSARPACARPSSTSDAGVLQQGPVQHQLRRGRRPTVLPADRVRGHARRRRSSRSASTSAASRARRSSPMPIEPLPTIPPPCADPPTRTASRSASTACPRSSCSTSTAATWLPPART